MKNNYLLFKKNNILFWIFIPALYFISLIYNFLITVIKFSHKNSIFFTYRPKLKVISVGNITLGGSGKTPLVEWIAEYLKKQNKKIGIIIRGYKRPHNNYKGIIKNNSSYFDIGDEASMLKEEFKDIKISVGRDKVYSASLLEKENC
ncbi:MAG: tetraacyldisaccharide 4'-kinase, partial [Candidatus Omnitrophica bacterium]|nr:tetraacyldisaccharide 4'-kinase [Candidatus Omnitrophota bacterium]